MPELTTFHYHGRKSRCTLGGRELHCGNCFVLFDSGGIGHDVRIELADDWVLIGLPGANMARFWDGAPAREYDRQ